MSENSIKNTTVKGDSNQEQKCLDEELLSKKMCIEDTKKHIQMVKSILYKNAKQLRESETKTKNKWKYIKKRKRKAGALTLIHLVEVLVYYSVYKKQQNKEALVNKIATDFKLDEDTKQIVFNTCKKIDFDKYKDVSTILDVLAAQLELKGELHDRSKLQYPEVSNFSKVNHLVKTIEYGSPEYKANVENILKVALTHHYRANRHHPEHFDNGILGMNLLDTIEMIADWKASSLRYKSGDVIKGIAINKERFKISPRCKEIFLNTASRMYRYKIIWKDRSNITRSYISDNFDEIYNAILTTSKVYKRDIVFLKQTLLNGVKAVQIENQINYILKIEEYGETSLYCN